MKNLICVLLLCGCGGTAGFTNISSSPRKGVVDKTPEFTVTVQEQILTKQDESIVILRENTTALAAIKRQVSDLTAATTEAVNAMEASLVKSSNPNGKESDPASALEPQENPRANQSQSTIPVASSPAVRSSSVVMKWNVDGNWDPSILETAKHLREDHGIIADEMSHQQMHDAHAAAHEGRKVANKSQSVQMINRGSSCPGGACPTPRRGLFGRRR